MNTMMPAATADVKDQFDQKYRAGIFNPVARHLREDLVEDRLAEGIGMAYEQYLRSASRGAPMGDALLVRACHVRSIDLGRRLAGAGGARPKQDVYDERNYKAGHVDLLRLDGLRDWDDGEDEQALLGWAEIDGINPAKMLASAVDLERWLGGLGADDRMMLALRQAGHTLGGIGAAMGSSTSTVFKRLRALGEELADVADVEIVTGERGVSRVIDRAQLAVTSDGDLLLNVARFDVPKKIEEIVRMALRQRGAVFIGVALAPAEVKRMLDEASMVLPNVTGPMVGRRQRAARRKRP